MKKLVFILLAFFSVSLSGQNLSKLEDNLGNYFLSEIPGGKSIKVLVTDFDKDGVLDYFSVYDSVQQVSYSSFIARFFGDESPYQHVYGVQKTFLPRKKLAGAEIINLNNDSLPDIQVLAGDSLIFLRNDSLGRKFKSFSFFIGDRPFKMSVLRDSSNQGNPKDRTLIIGSDKRNVYLFSPDTSSLLMLSSFLLPIFVQDFSVYDFNHDSRQDVVFIGKNGLDDSLRVLTYCLDPFGNLDSVSGVVLPPVSKVYSSRVADLFLDGYPDLAISTNKYQTYPVAKDSLIIINFQAANQFVIKTISFNSTKFRYFSDFETSDFNRDGFPDIFITSPNGLNHLMLTNNQNGEFVVDSTVFAGNGTFYPAHSLRPVFRNQDNKLDLLILSEKTNFVIMLNGTPYVPDLKAKVKLSAPLAGHNSTLTAAIKIFNIGDTVASNINFLSRVTIKDSTGQVLSSFSRTDTTASLIIPGDSLNLTLNFDSLEIPKKAKLFIDFYLDSLNLISELRESNNFYSDSVLASAPDLCFGSVSVPNIYQNTSSITLNVWAKNIGECKLPSGAKINGILSFNEIGGPTTVANYFVNVLDSISPGDSILLNIPLGISPISGHLTYDLILRLDSSNQVVELEEGNNVFEIHNISIPGPDLIVSNINFPTTFGNWYHGDLKVKVKNIGNYQASSSNGIKLMTSVLLVRDDTVFYERVYNHPLSTILPNDSIEITILTDSLNMRVDSLFIYSFIDYDATIIESDETNNSLLKAIELLGTIGNLPDLIVSNINFPTTFGNWYQGNVSVWVKNIGNYDATTTTGIRLKTSFVLTRADTVYYQKEYSNFISQLNFGDSIEVLINVDSLNMTVDSLIISTFIDADSVIIESSESNNCLVSRIKLLGTIGIKESEISQNFSLYPNPASDFICLDFSSQDRISLEIYNNFGQKIWSKENIFQLEKIDLSLFAPGVYLINIRSSHGAITKKFIKK